VLNSVSGAQVDMETHTHTQKQSLGLPQSGHTDQVSQHTTQIRNFSVTYVNLENETRKCAN